MADCSNVEMRELLPERAGGALSVADAARVDAHLSSCGRCTAELAVIRAARRALRVSPSIDVARITSAVVAATGAPSRPRLVASAAGNSGAGRRPALRWIGWKAAAAITIAAAGVGSFAVWNSANEPAGEATGALPNVVASASPSRGAPISPTLVAPDPQPVVAVASTAGSTIVPELAVGGGLADLTDGDLQSLLGDIGAASTAGVAGISFEEPDAIVPTVGVTADEESI